MDDIYIPTLKTTQPTAVNREPIEYADEIRECLWAEVPCWAECDVIPPEPETSACGGVPGYVEWYDIDDVEIELVDAFTDDVPNVVGFECNVNARRSEDEVTGCFVCALVFYGHRKRNVGEDQQITTLVAQYRIDVS